MPFAHKGLAGSVDMRSYTSTLHGRVSIQRCGTEGDGRLVGGRPVAYIFIYPNLMISTCCTKERHLLWMCILPVACQACC